MSVLFDKVGVGNSFITVGLSLEHKCAGSYLFAFSSEFGNAMNVGIPASAAVAVELLFFSVLCWRNI